MKKLSENKNLKFNSTNENRNIFTFVQISDIHISKFLKKGHISHLIQFLESELPLINPEFVIVTGDLTDAKDFKKLNSFQYIEEWEAYFDLLKLAKVLRKRNNTFWFDQRGNHDCFNVLNDDKKLNFFKNFSSVKSTSGYNFNLVKDFGVYNFVSLDACPKYGTTRPFNFFGYYDIEDMDHLSASLNEFHNHSFVMSHYPTSTTLFGKSSKGETFEQLSNLISVFFSGHLHTLFFNLGGKMFGHQGSGFLELELGDLKSHGFYRIVSVDNDFISFSDRTLQKDGEVLPLLALNKTNSKEYNFSKAPTYKENLNFKPVVLITNPKDNKFILEKREPVNKLSEFNFIRVLIYSPFSVDSVQIFLNGELHKERVYYHGIGKSMENFADETEPYLPLWISPFNFKELDPHSIYNILVVVNDSLGNTANASVNFRLDGKRTMGMGFGWFQEWVILTSFPRIFKDIFVYSYLTIMIGFLLVPKIFTSIKTKNGTYLDWRYKVCTQLKEIDTKSFKRSSSFFNFDSRQNSVVMEGNNDLVEGKKQEDSKVKPEIKNEKGVFFKLRSLSKKKSNVFKTPTLPSSNLKKCESEQEIFVQINFKNFFYKPLEDLYFFFFASFLRFCELSRVDKIFFPLYFFGLYMIIGPFFIGELVPSSPNYNQKFAGFFLYGIWFADGEFLPLTDTWLQGCHELLYSYLPLTVYLSFCYTNPKLLYTQENSRFYKPIHSKIYIIILVFFIILYQLSQSYTIGIFYGTISVLISPLKSWFSVWGSFQIFKVWYIGLRNKELFFDQNLVKFEEHLPEEKSVDENLLVDEHLK
ncbi:Transmembrane protein 62, partial [Lobulomyces angularis]